MVSTSIDQLACVLREHRSPDSLVVLPLLLAAAVAFGPGTFTELGAACTSPTLSDFLLSLSCSAIAHAVCAGAFDGESGSQTVHLERCFGWRGLLLEANPTNYAQIASKHRDHATVVHSAVCSQRGTVQIGNASSSVTGIEGTMSLAHQAKWRPVQGTSVTVPCAPLGELMMEAHFPKVTFLSLDVEGAELEILLSLSPLGRRLPFSVILVETLRYDGSRNAQIIKLLRENRTGLTQLPHPHFAGSQNALFATSDLKLVPPKRNASAIRELLRRARAPAFIAALKAHHLSASELKEMRQIAHVVPEILGAALDEAGA